MYVVGIDGQKNQVIIGPKTALYKDTLKADHLTWTRGYAPADKFQAHIKIRNLHHAAPADVTLNPDGTLLAKFKEPQLSITAGQSAVLYDGDVVLGGGIIL
jgi:tRNA-specific 2-thiouridylase